MSLGLAHRKELQKRRSQRFWFLFKTVLLLGILFGLSYLAFDTGQQIALQSISLSQEKYDQQAVELEALRRELGTTEATLYKMQKLLPNQEIQDLLSVINRKAADGVAPDRMAALIAGLSQDENCADESQAKRFVITTPVSQMADGAASFFRGLITLTGKGSPTLNEEGLPESWYDPTKPVIVNFTLPGGETQTAEGELPLYHSVVINDQEYRFTVTAGGRSFAEVNVRSCTL